jgi:DNA polymerase-3 subunit beta
VKLQVERDPLAEAVAWTARALPARPTAPVLAGMRLQAGSELTLSTFDYEVSAQSTIPVQADEPGTVLVSGRLRSSGRCRPSRSSSPPTGPGRPSGAAARHSR